LLTVREEHKLRVFENRVLRRIFGPKRDGVTGVWRKLHNEELVNVEVGPRLLILFTLTYKSRTASHIPEDHILHSYRRENLKSYIKLTGWAL
jgi:hypothetical protein